MWQLVDQYGPLGASILVTVYALVLWFIFRNKTS